jgi:hypothetical protein
VASRRSYRDAPPDRQQVEGLGTDRFIGRVRKGESNHFGVFDATQAVAVAVRDSQALWFVIPTSNSRF